jgi:hypothetical protein
MQHVEMSTQSDGQWFDACADKKLLQLLRLL